MKRLSSLLSIWACACAAVLPAHAEQSPQSTRDPRVGVLDYVSDEVYLIRVARGAVTRIALGRDEVITEAATGFVANCLPDSEWCIKAEKGSSQIWIKPLLNATQNNLEVATNQRDYSFRLHVQSGAEHAQQVHYRISFRHPMNLGKTSDPRWYRFDTPPGSASGASLNTASAKSIPSEDEHPTPQVRNHHYLKRGTSEALIIAPTVVFDDGRFTYMRFPMGQEVPAVFAVTVDGQETRISSHAERLSEPEGSGGQKAERDYLVAHRLAPRWVLRLGTAVVELINTGYDRAGIETYSGSTDPRYRRQDLP